MYILKKFSKKQSKVILFSNWILSETDKQNILPHYVLTLQRERQNVVVILWHFDFHELLVKTGSESIIVPVHFYTLAAIRSPLVPYWGFPLLKVVTSVGKFMHYKTQHCRLRTGTGCTLCPTVCVALYKVNYLVPLPNFISGFTNILIQHQTTTIWPLFVQPKKVDALTNLQDLCQVQSTLCSEHSFLLLSLFVR